MTFNEYIDWLIRIKSLPLPSTEAKESSDLVMEVEQYPYQLSKRESQFLHPSLTARSSTQSLGEDAN